MKRSIPAEILTQHVAVLGKTGSGKTSTAKLAIEQVVADGSRVCILDPIKSDWWGLTSSANGKHAGLPFHILGGPHGHVPLHSAAGKAIADVVASGGLPLSIIDMAEFEPGGQARFFVDFAPTLLRKMRGVVYLVIEEAHLFAPKERSGIGAENLSIHWAKTLATAGRSKGVRLMLVTQRTQALHNALLGSCDTLIAHRLTAPADQEPVVKWLKANTTKEVLEEVSGSLASLKTGEGWICSGEAKLFERVHFPRIHTYDNTATPTGDGETRQIKTAAVDADKLRTLIGQAVDQAKADDPRELRKQIADLKKEIASIRSVPPAKESAPPKTVEKFVLKDGDRELIERFIKAFEKTVNEIYGVQSELLTEHLKVIERETQRLWNQFEGIHQTERQRFARTLDSKGFQAIIDKIASPRAPQPVSGSRGVPDRKTGTASPNRGASRVEPPRARVESRPPSNGNGAGDPSIGKSGLRRMLIALAQRPQGLTRSQLGLRAQVSAKGGSFDTYLSKARVPGWVINDGDRIRITEEGLKALGSYDPLPEGRELLDYYVRHFGSSGAARMLTALADAYPRALSRQELSEQSNVSAAGGSFDTYLSKLRTLELVEGKAELRASEELFS